MIIVKQSPSIWTSFSMSTVWRRVPSVSPLLWLLLKWLAKERLRVLLPERELNQTTPGITQHHPHSKQLNRATHGYHYWHDSVTSWFNSASVQDTMWENKHISLTHTLHFANRVLYRGQRVVAFTYVWYYVCYKYLQISHRWWSTLVWHKSFDLLSVSQPNS